MPPVLISFNAQRIRNIICIFIFSYTVNHGIYSINIRFLHSHELCINVYFVNGWICRLCSSILTHNDYIIIFVVWLSFGFSYTVNTELYFTNLRGFDIYAYLCILYMHIYCVNGLICCLCSSVLAYS